MAEEKKKGIFSKLFGANKSSCCNVQIVEVSEEEKKEADKDEIQDKGRSPRTSS
ncbi:MAG: hypothetical protein U5R49_04665 [Deltaproteobacteria bacterium]|nr:hypothetical protein [Deltaproteobacteria bacterium]